MEKFIDDKLKKGRIDIGKLGEDLACRFIIKKGYQVVERNHRKPWGEIDIISRAPDGTLVFFEVKTMVENNKAFLSPEDNATKTKLQKLYKICQGFAVRHEELIDQKKGWRIDLLAVTMGATAEREKEQLTDIYKNCIIKHYENI